jgi:hypothetical protein
MPNGAKTSASIPAQLEIDPDVAEQFASTFVPVWQFEDAPFTAGKALSSEDIQALGPGAGANSERVPDPFPQAAAAPVDPFARAPDAADPAPTPASVVLAAPVKSAADAPVAAHAQGVEDSPFLRSPSKRLLVGVGAGIAATLGVLAVTLTRAKDPAPTADLGPASAFAREADSAPVLTPPPAALSSPSHDPSPAPLPQAATDTEPAPGKEPASASAKPAAPVRAPAPAPGPRREKSPSKRSTDVDFGI